jgi:uncharacterized protein YkwD
LRKATTALLAASGHVAATVGATVRRSLRSRAGIALGLALLLGLDVIGVSQPTATVATPNHPILPLTRAEFKTSVGTDHGLTEPVTIAFSTAMDLASVASMLRIEPATDVRLGWNNADTLLTITPTTHWAVGTFHTVTVDAGALALSGQPLPKPARAIFVTRAATAVSLAATDLVAGKATVGTDFLLSFARPVDPTTLDAALTVQPAVQGTIKHVDLPGDAADAPVTYRFVPSTALRANATYRVIVSGARDTNGVALEPAALTVQTLRGPAVVRFRPFANSTDIARNAVLSVRFTERMERRSTARAFTVKAGGKAIAGRVAWAENDTVLVFTPARALPAASTVTMAVSTTARGASGVPLGAASRATFKTSNGSAGSGQASGGPAITGGNAVGGGNWAAVETYYLGLMNCTRTGGWVTSTGHCSSPGGRNVAPLKLDRGISTYVSRPYARRLAVGADCSHFIGGNPGDRLRRAGYTSYRWAENLGCRSGNPRAAVLASHLFFQSEKSYGGGHYVNLMNAAYDRVGIGVWVSGGRVRLVIDFYHP